jgi:hypothetical protein
MNELIARWKTEMPSFFKTVSLVGKFLVGAGGVTMAAVLAAPELVSPAVLQILKVVSSYLVFGGGIIAGVSQLTVKDYEELQTKLHEKNTGTDKDVA